MGEVAPSNTREGKRMWVTGADGPGGKPAPSRRARSVKALRFPHKILEVAPKHHIATIAALLPLAVTRREATNESRVSHG